MHMAEELRAGKAELIAVLHRQPAPRSSAAGESGGGDRQSAVGSALREAEHFFSPRGALEAVLDLRDTLFRGAARKLLEVGETLVKGMSSRWPFRQGGTLLDCHTGMHAHTHTSAECRTVTQGLLDEERGTARQILQTNYNLREPIMVNSPWADHAARCYAQLRDIVAPAGLPPSALQQVGHCPHTHWPRHDDFSCHPTCFSRHPTCDMKSCLSFFSKVWEQAIATGSEAMLDGLFRIKRCTFEGRASMSYDLAHVERCVS